MKLTTIAAVTGGVLHGPDRTVTGAASLDSRAVPDGGLFVAVAGEHVDGHDYAAAAVEAGAAGVLGSRPGEVPTVVVDDVTDALGRLARHVLAEIAGPRVFAITGSQGKTGTKDYLAHVLAGDGPTVATAGNYNNELGVPLTVLRSEGDTAHLVVEMGARGLGHVAHLCTIAPPRIATVVNVGTAHLGEFGSREAIAAAKGEIVEALPPDGTAVLNADDPWVLPMRTRTTAEVLTFGEHGDVCWRDLTLDEVGRPSFRLLWAGDSRPVRLTQIGAHQVVNATAAATMALAAGIDLDLVAERLSTARPASRWRMEVTERPDGLLVVNDAYNANPESTVAALEALAAIGTRGSRRTVAVLGEMRELGAEHRAGHRRVGEAAARLGIDVVVVVGPEAAAILEGARDAAHAGKLVGTAGRDEARDWVRHNVRSDDAVLVKASRGVALEHVVDALLDQTDPQEDHR